MMGGDAAFHRDLVDRIYEAAFVPEKWLEVIPTLVQMSGSASGAVLVFKPEEIVRFIATEPTAAVMAEFTAGRSPPRNPRMVKSFAMALVGQRGFHRADDVLLPEEKINDPGAAGLAAAGLGGQAGLTTPLPTGEAAAVTFERRLVDGLHEDHELAALNALSPHLSRASLISARLGLERAEATVSALQAIGLPGAVLTRSGSALATNEMFDAMPWLFRPGAFGRIALADEGANALYAAAVESIRTGHGGAVRSIPIAASEGTPPAVIHVTPLVRAAYDIFSGAEILVAATTITPSDAVPSPSILMGLFDLTPSEARLAAALGPGRPLGEAAVASGITVKSARTYLERIFTKTGTHRQTELVALLRGAAPFPRQ